MKKLLSILTVCLAVASCTQAPVATSWQIAGDRITTEWGENLDPSAVLQEYPRPQMVRDQWINLNGMWNFATDSLSGEILVPFAIESALSGVGATLKHDEKLVYTREFSLPGSYCKNGHVLLHAGAIDQIATIFVNDKKVGEHVGGYASFSFDITPYAKRGKNTIRVEVIDNTDDNFMAVGKQTRRPRGIWYTSVSGIWQTIWVEHVPQQYISGLKITPDVDASTLNVTLAVADATEGCTAKVAVIAEGKVVAEAAAPVAGGAAECAVAIENPHLWNTDDPFLYDLTCTIADAKGKMIDKVESYAAMRKVSIAADADGHKRICLNDKQTFMIGPLDQGWWPDGLYTAPTDEALAFDIIKTKELGFNTIRKHVKVEPDRWYYHCDRLGMLVWQDMPSGDIPGSPWPARYNFIDEDCRQRSAESMADYYHEWNEIMDQLYNHPSIVIWVPFNEGWGQSNSVEVAEWTKAKDPSRLVNIASGGNLLRAGDILDLHHYPHPSMDFYDPAYVNVLGEYGGIGLSVPGHSWVDDKSSSHSSGSNWGYINMEGIESVTAKYVEYAGMLKELVSKGFAAGIYTQTTDCEIEVNGLMTYDRKVMKVKVEDVCNANMALQKAL